ncbi:MAG TPA: alpha/beta fold hydrolase [Gemmatimonadaceae bacterium]|nr:alpha/beta fold hydrolase [Gemmatimonadaceae bacterium]
MTDTTSYIEHACTLAVSGWNIPAALTLPVSHSNEARLESAILLVPGSLFSDVNGDYPSWNSFPSVYAHLARQLAARGHAVYRFAKLGPGTGSVATDAEPAAAVRNWAGRLIIADAALSAMRAELESRGVRVARVVGAGHSEGSVIVSQLATSQRAGELDGVVLLAGPSVGILEIMREQIGAMTPPAELPAAAERLDAVIGYVRRGEPVPAEFAAPSGMGAAALATMPDDARRYMRESDATDPKALAAAMTQRVIVVQGGNDSSVPTHHGEALRDILKARPDGEARTDFLFVPEVQHMLKVVPPGIPPQEAFGYPGETDARVTDGIDRWIRDLAR